EVTKLLDGNDEALGMFQAAMASARTFMVARERCKTNNVRALHEIRLCFNELGRRMADAGHLDHYRQIYMLKESELDDYFDDPAAFTAERQTREIDFMSLFDLMPPYIVDTKAPPLAEWDRRADATTDAVAVGDVLTGIAGSAGVATGTAKVL